MKKEQLEFLDWELGVFFHFGIRTFYENHRDWDMIEMSLEVFNPTALDCDSWIKTISEAGARYAVFICKHHEGFALWPSEYTRYSVANTPWRDGTGDVVKEFVDACRKYGVHVGLYYSPAQFGFDTQKAQDYDEYFIAQINELLSGYGKIDYLWFDGCGSENHTYDTKRIVEVIRRLQPEILIFNMWDPDVRWVGNESGMAHLENRNMVRCLDFSVKTGLRQYLDQDRFLPVECDCRIRLENWFYSENDEHTLKSLDELMGMYYYSVGRGANLLINLAPDRRGLLTEADEKRFLEFGNEIKKRFKAPIDYDGRSEKTSYICELPQPTVLNTVVLEECLSQEMQICDFEILAHPFSYGEPITVFPGKTIGHKAICEFPSFFTKKIEIVFQHQNDIEKLKNVKLFNTRR